MFCTSNQNKFACHWPINFDYFFQKFWLCLFIWERKNLKKLHILKCSIFYRFIKINEFLLLPRCAKLFKTTVWQQRPADLTVLIEKDGTNNNKNPEEFQFYLSLALKGDCSQTKQETQCRYSFSLTFDCVLARVKRKNEFSFNFSDLKTQTAAPYMGANEIRWSIENVLCSSV